MEKGLDKIVVERVSWSKSMERVSLSKSNRILTLTFDIIPI
jgi:hypothetical protein